jgi:kynurenine aminotransferase
VFCANSISQEATAVALEKSIENKFFETQRLEYIERRQVMMEELDNLGLPYSIPDGAYFILLNTSQLELPSSFIAPDIIKGRARDWSVAWFVAETAGVVTIPPTDFYSVGNWSLGENYLRIAFCKDTDTLREAGKRLLKLMPFIRKN